LDSARVGVGCQPHVTRLGPGFDGVEDEAFAVGAVLGLIPFLGFGWGEAGGWDGEGKGLGGWLGRLRVLQGEQKAGLFLMEVGFAFAELLFAVGEHLLFATDVFPHLGAGLERVGGRGEEAVFGVGDDLFERLLGEGLGVRGKLLMGREIGAGDLEAVEEETGAAGIEIVGGEALEDEADGELDGGAVLGNREQDGGAAGFARVRFDGGAAGGVVVVAELFVAERGGATAASVDEDVAAAVACRLLDSGLVGHLGTLPVGVLRAKYSKGRS
jgi:hypothetical protein